ncbi:MAG: EF-hand domain-containing protein [Trebonia sp.]
MTTPTITRERLEKRFRLWDANHDGLIDRSDFETEASQLVRAFGEHENSPRASQVHSAFGQLWDYLAEKVGPGTTSMTLDQFEKVSLQEIIIPGDAGFSKVLRPMIQAVAALCDTNGDNRIDPSEFGKWLRAIKADPAQADSLFRDVDANGDGYLSIDELVGAIQAYHEGKLDVSLLGA